MADLMNENNCSNLTALDLYDDLLTDEKVKEQESLSDVQVQLTDARLRIVNLEKNLQEVQESERFYKQRSKVLEKNISALFLTAKLELERKNSQISELRNAVEKASDRKRFRGKQYKTQEFEYGLDSSNVHHWVEHMSERDDTYNDENQTESSATQYLISEIEMSVSGCDGRKRKLAWEDTATWTKRSKLESVNTTNTSSRESRYKPAAVILHCERSRDGFDTARKLVQKSKRDLLKRRSGEHVERSRDGFDRARKLIQKNDKESVKFKSSKKQRNMKDEECKNGNSSRRITEKEISQSRTEVICLTKSEHQSDKENSSSPRKLQSIIHVHSKILSPLHSQVDSKSRISSEENVEKSKCISEGTYRKSTEYQRHRGNSRNESFRESGYKRRTIDKSVRDRSREDYTSKDQKKHSNRTVDRRPRGSKREEQKTESPTKLREEKRDERKREQMMDLANLSHRSQKDKKNDTEKASVMDESEDKQSAQNLHKYCQLEEKRNTEHKRNVQKSPSNRGFDLRDKLKMKRKKNSSTEEESGNLSDLYGNISSFEGPSQDTSHTAECFIEELLLEKSDQSVNLSGTAYMNEMLPDKNGKMNKIEVLEVNITEADTVQHDLNTDKDIIVTEKGENWNVDNPNVLQVSSELPQNVKLDRADKNNSFDIDIYITEQENQEFNIIDLEDDPSFALNKTGDKKRNKHSKSMRSGRSEISLSVTDTDFSNDRYGRKPKISPKINSECHSRIDSTKKRKKSSDDHHFERRGRRHSSSKHKTDDTFVMKRQITEPNKESKSNESDVQLLQCSNHVKSTYLDYIHKIDKFEEANESKFLSARPKILKLPISPITSNVKTDDTDNEQNQTAVSIDYDKISACEKSVEGKTSTINDKNSACHDSNKMQTKFVSAKGRTVVLVSENVNEVKKDENACNKTKTPMKNVSAEIEKEQDVLNKTNTPMKKTSSEIKKEENVFNKTKTPMKKLSVENLQSDADFLCKVKKRHIEERTVKSVNIEKCETNDKNNETELNRNRGNVCEPQGNVFQDVQCSNDNHTGGSCSHEHAKNTMTDSYASTSHYIGSRICMSLSKDTTVSSTSINNSKTKSCNNISTGKLIPNTNNDSGILETSESSAIMKNVQNDDRDTGVTLNRHNALPVETPSSSENNKGTSGQFSTVKETMPCDTFYCDSDSKSSGKLKIITEENSMSSVRDNTSNTEITDEFQVKEEKMSQRHFYNVSIEAIKTSIEERIKNRNESVSSVEHNEFQAVDEIKVQGENDSYIESTVTLSEGTVQREADIVHVMEVAQDSFSKFEIDVNINDNRELVSMENILGNHIFYRQSWEEFENKEEKCCGDKTSDVVMVTDEYENDVPREVFSETESITEFFDEQSQLELAAASSLRASDGIQVCQTSFEGSTEQIDPDNLSRQKQDNDQESDVCHSENDVTDNLGTDSNSVLECMEISLMADTLSDAWTEKIMSSGHSITEENKTVQKKLNVSEEKNESSLYSDVGHFNSMTTEICHTVDQHEVTLPGNQRSPEEVKRDEDLEEGEITSESEDDELYVCSSQTAKSAIKNAETDTKTISKLEVKQDLRHKLVAKKGSSASKNRGSDLLRLDGCRSEKRSHSSSDRHLSGKSDGGKHDKKQHLSSERSDKRSTGKSEKHRSSVEKSIKHLSSDKISSDKSKKHSSASEQNYPSKSDKQSTMDKSDKQYSSSERTDKHYSSSERTDKHYSSERMDKHYSSSGRQDKQYLSSDRSEKHSLEIQLMRKTERSKEVSKSKKSTNQSDRPYNERMTKTSSCETKQRGQDSRHDIKSRNEGRNKLNPIKKAYLMISEPADSSTKSRKDRSTNKEAKHRSSDKSRTK